MKLALDFCNQVNYLTNTHQIYHLSPTILTYGREGIVVHEHTSYMSLTHPT